MNKPTGLIGKTETGGIISESNLQERDEAMMSRRRVVIVFMIRESMEPYQ